MTFSNHTMADHTAPLRHKEAVSKISAPHNPDSKAPAFLNLAEFNIPDQIDVRGFEPISAPSS